MPTRPARPINHRTSQRRKAANAAEPRPVPTREIRRTDEAILWGRSAGRCQFAGCNRILSRSSVTQEQVNVAQKAHIYSFSPTGPRGHNGIASRDLNTVANLMLVCHECHEKIDQAPDGGRYTVVVLREMKAQHERRIEIVAGIAPGRGSHVLFYGANTGDHSACMSFNEAAGAMFPDRYPAEATPLFLGTVNSSFTDRTPEFWQIEADNLRSQFERRVRERIAIRAIDHLSVFALAPQPLLVLLGSFLGDITPADVYQRHREPPTWAWPAGVTTLAFDVKEPSSVTGTPALVLSLSATVTADRIKAVLGPDTSIWTVTVPSPHNDLTKTRAQLSQFRTLLRSLLDRIKAAHGQTATLHVFPVASASMAVETGRVRMPKADMPWRVYDQVNARGGFISALSIPYGASS